MYHISQLNIYPVKSLGGFSLPSVTLTDRGFEFDRRWMLVNEAQQFLTQREFPKMALLQTAIDHEGLNIFHKENENDRISLPLYPTAAKKLMVTIWNDTVQAQFVSSKADEWLSEKLSAACRLVYMPDETKRKVDSRYAFNNEITAFPDGYPLLIIGEASLQDLNSRFTEILPMNRFRPNIVFSGGLPYEEDRMEHFVINDIDFYGVKLSARCPIITTNQETASRSKEPLKTLATYRALNNNIYFGQNLLYNKTGVLHTGDRIDIKKKKSAPLFNTAVT